MRASPGGEAIAYGRLRQRQRRVPRRFAKSAVLGFPQVEHLFKTAAFLFSWGRGSANGGSPRIKKRQDSAPSRRMLAEPLRQETTQHTSPSPQVTPSPSPQVPNAYPTQQPPQLHQPPRRLDWLPKSPGSERCSIGTGRNAAK